MQRQTLNLSLSPSVLESITWAYLMVSSKAGDPKEREKTMAASNKAIEGAISDSTNMMLESLIEMDSLAPWRMTLEVYKPAFTLPSGSLGI